MIYTLLAFVFAGVAVLVIHRAITMLLAASWFMGWLRGMLGLSLLVIAVGAGLLAYDIYTYRPVLLEQPVATVSFEGTEPQHFTAVVVEQSGSEKRVSLHGDQWQLNARFLKWKGFLSSMDIKPAYRLDRLSGRFYDIQAESSETRTHHSITTSFLGIDLWRFIYDHPKWFPIIDTTYGSATYLPMKVGALYEVYLSNAGLVARPLNDAAKKAISEWH